MTLPADAVARLAIAPEHRRHEGIGRRHRADRRSRGGDARRLQRARRHRRRRSTRRCAPARAGGILALARVVPGRVRAAVRSGRAPASTTRRARCSASCCRSRGCLGPAYGVPGLKAALRSSATTSAIRGRRLLPLPTRPSTAIRETPAHVRGSSSHEPAARHRSHPARSRSEPDRPARDARDGGADRQPSRSADARAARRCAGAPAAACFGAPDGSFALAVSGTGTSGMETAVANLVEPGTRVLVDRHRLFRRSPRADVRALRRDGRRGSTSNGAAPCDPDALRAALEARRPPTSSRWCMPRRRPAC